MKIVEEKALYTGSIPSTKTVNCHRPCHHKNAVLRHPDRLMTPPDGFGGNIRADRWR